MRGLIKLILIFTLIGGIAYAMYSHFAAGGAPAPGGPGGAPPVKVAEVISREVQMWQEFSGRLAAVDSAEVRPQVSGIITQVHFKEGEWVKAGEPLFTIDQRPYQAALRAAEARASQMQADLERARLLLKEKAIPQREFDQRRNDAASAQAALTQAKLDFEHSVVRAPIAGRVGRAEITEGNLVSVANPMVLTVVVDDKPIYADFDIDEQTYLNYAKVTGADPKKIRAIPVMLGLANEVDAPHQGRLQSFDNRLDVKTGTLRARAVFDNADGRLVPGLYARVRLGGAETRQAMLITDRAVGTDQSKKFVVVVHPDGKTERRYITIDGLAEGLRVVTSGLQPGEKIIVSGTQRVMMPGMPVTPELVGMEDQGPEAGGQGSGQQESVAQ